MLSIQEARNTALKKEVVTACHIIVKLALDSGPFGNVSQRVPGTNYFWVNPAGLTFDQLTVDNMVCVDEQGHVFEGKHEAHPGTFIHREIYRLRPDVLAIVHTHSANTVTHSLLGCTIEPFTQLGASIYTDQGYYHGFTGPVRTMDEGAAIAAALENKSIVIAKNHGLFTTAKTIQAALWDMVIADMAAGIHINALQLGLRGADILPPEFMLKSRLEVRDKQNAFMWESYVDKLGRK
jgi:L-ribulose-5-phosphate 4-epimerase